MAATLQELDSLYDQRLELEPVKKIVSECQAMLKENPRGYELLWRLSRAYFHLARESASSNEKLDLYKKAVDTGRQAAEANPSRPEGHFWLGISTAGLGETKGILKSLTSTGDVKKEMEQVVAIDDTYEEGGAYRILGRVEHKVPRVFGGSKTRSYEYYKKALAIAPDNTYTHLFLAELLTDDGKTQEAHKELELILKAKNNPKWAYDIKVNRAEARKLLEDFEKEDALKKYKEQAP